MFLDVITPDVLHRVTTALNRHLLHDSYSSLPRGTQLKSLQLSEGSANPTPHATGQSLSAPVALRAVYANPVPHSIRHPDLEERTITVFIKTTPNIPDEAKRLRVIPSAVNEAHFYSTLAPRLNGSSTRPPLLLDATFTPAAARLASGQPAQHENEDNSPAQVTLVLEDVSHTKYIHTSPLPSDSARAALSALAALHAGFWERRDALSAARAVLSAPACYWALARRPQAELANIPSKWAEFCEGLQGMVQDISVAGALGEEKNSENALIKGFLSTPGIRELGSRLQAVAKKVDDDLHGIGFARMSAASLEIAGGNLGVVTSDAWRTVVHGDAKAMNMFLPASEEPDARATLVDFQWAGVGPCMCDVALLLAHGVERDALSGGRHDGLLRWYYAALSRGIGADAARRFPYEAAVRLYKLAVVDYGRMVVGRFLGDGAVETFRQKKGDKNASMVYRDVGGCVEFFLRVREYLTEVEQSS